MGRTRHIISQISLRPRPAAAHSLSFPIWQCFQNGQQAGRVHGSRSRFLVHLFLRSICFRLLPLASLSVLSCLLISSTQATIEDSLGGELSFAVQPGDVVLRYVGIHVMVYTCQNTLSMSILRPIKQLIINSSNSQTSV